MKKIKFCGKLLTFLELTLFIHSSVLFSQGLTGPEQATSGTAITYQFTDDFLVAEPKWVTSSASITSYSSGASYFADVTWSEPGDYELRFQDGEFLLSSIRVSVTAGCTMPPQPNAGVDLTGIENCGKTSIQLAASPVPDGLIGQWQIVSGLGATFSDPVKPNALFSGLPDRDYILRWTVGRDNCFSFDEVVVRFHDQPHTIPSISGNQRIGPGTFSLEASGNQAGEQFQWVNEIGTVISTQATFKTEAFSFSQPYFADVRVVSKYGCPGIKRSVGLFIEPSPTILSDQNFLSPGRQATLRSDRSYDTYTWKNSFGAIMGNGPEVSVNEAGMYQLEVSKSGFSGTGYSTPYEVRSAFTVSARNNTVTTIARKPVQTLAGAQQVDLNQTVTYIDGLGRPLQEIQQNWSPDFRDRITPFVYDSKGRNYRQFLPVLHNGPSGSFRENFLTQENLYNAESLSFFKDAWPYTEITYEPSPLNEPISVLEPGQNWKNSNRSKKYNRTTNQTGSAIGQELLIAWEVSAQTGLPIRKIINSNMVKDGYYSTGALEIQSVKDEHGYETRTYRDQFSRIVLKKIQAVENPSLNDPLHWLQTYYIYDALGRLRFILQPELVKTLVQSNRNPSASEIYTMGFRYRYDALGRVVVSQEPGKDSVYMIYDHRDRVVLTQDGNQRNSSPYRWTFYKYDALNRQIATGLKDTLALLSQKAMQEVVHTFYRTKIWALPYERFIGFSTSNLHGYSNRSYPIVTNGAGADPQRYLKVIYYDHYQFLSGLKNPGAFIPNEISGSTPASQTFSGVETGNKVKVLDGGLAGGFTWLATVTYYDRDIRPIQIQKDNYRGGVDVLSMSYDFNGLPMRKRWHHVSQDVSWKDQAGLYQQGNKLIRGNASAGWTAGSASVQILGPAQDGWMEFTATETNTIRAIGWSDQNSNTNYTSIDFAIYLNNNGTISIFEQAAGKFVAGNFGTYRSGDQFRIERKSGAIRYYRNNQLLRASTVPSTTSLMVDVSLSTPGSTLAGIRTSLNPYQMQIDERFVYDHQGRLLENWHKVDQQPEVLMIKNDFDANGQIKSKSLHSTDRLARPKQRVDYQYTIRGWLETINDLSQWSVDQTTEYPDFFGEDIFYEKVDPVGNQPKFNGVISSVRFRSHPGPSQPKQSAFLFTYDPVNRIQSGIQKKLNGSQWILPGNEEQITGYDFNGNIRSLVRKVNASIVDDLMYQYPTTSNQLNTVQDRSTEKFTMFQDGNTSATVDYTYDRNGNMLTDLNKGISQIVQYNILDLPEIVSRGVNRIQLMYTAEGEKVAETSFFSGLSNALTRGIRQTEWCGPIEFVDDQVLQVDHAEGRVVMQETETVFTEDGTNKNLYSVSGATSNTTTINGEKYVTITSTSTTPRSGIQVIGGQVAVKAGERYVVKIKGYRVAGTAKTSNPVYISIKINGVDLLWPGAGLPTSAVTEHVIEQLIDVPTSGTMTIGLTWNTVLSGEVIYLNQAELVKLTPSMPVYQYYLKDHLENIRTVFTATPKTDARLATAEPSALPSERRQFLRFENVKFVNSALFDRTNGDQSGTSVRLNGSSNERFGLACSLAVMPGDVIEAEVWAKFVDPISKNWTSVFSSLIASIGSGSTSIVTDGTSYSSSTSSFPYSAYQNTSGSSGIGPKAYMNWLVFDKKFNFLSQYSGYVRMTDIAREYGQNTPHERMKSPSITIQEQGYVYIYFSNEESVPLEVYFDDFSVVNRQSPIVQTVDYFPFGLPFDQQFRENSIPSSKKYNSMREQSVLGLGWLEPLKYRTYDAAQARFMQVDPVVKDHESLYAWNTNNPLLFSDPFGADSVQRAKALQEAERYINKNPNPKGKGGYGFAGYHAGAPGQPIDCSGMVSQCAEASGFGTLNNYVRGKPNNTGVRNILEQPLTREVGVEEIVEGNIVVFPNKTHVAFISDIVRDNNDQVTGFTLIHSERSGGPNKDVIDLTNPNNFYVRKYLGVGGTRANYYSWDTPDKPLTPKQKEIQ